MRRLVELVRWTDNRATSSSAAGTTAAAHPATLLNTYWVHDDNSFGDFLSQITTYIGRPDDDGHDSNEAKPNAYPPPSQVVRQRHESTNIQISGIIFLEAVKARVLRAVSRTAMNFEHDAGNDAKKAVARESRTHKCLQELLCFCGIAGWGIRQVQIHSQTRNNN